MRGNSDKQGPALQDKQPNHENEGARDNRPLDNTHWSVLPKTTGQDKRWISRQIPNVGVPYNTT